MIGKSKSVTKPPIFELKITLEDVEPLVWRRFRVDPLCTLPLLHLIIQAVMGWDNHHLHRFEAGGNAYEPKGPEVTGSALDERRYRLLSLVKRPDEGFLPLRKHR